MEQNKSSKNSLEWQRFNNKTDCISIAKLETIINKDSNNNSITKKAITAHFLDIHLEVLIEIKYLIDNVGRCIVYYKDDYDSEQKNKNLINLLGEEDYYRKVENGTIMLIRIE